jgi:hypothetical protein
VPWQLDSVNHGRYFQNRCPAASPRCGAAAEENMSNGMMRPHQLMQAAAEMKKRA